MERHIKNTIPDYNSFVAELRRRGEEDIRYTSSADYSRLCSEVNPLTTTKFEGLSTRIPDPQPPDSQTL